jgi:hypothetical protein
MARRGFCWQLIMAGRKIMADLHVSNSSESGSSVPYWCTFELGVCIWKWYLFVVRKFGDNPELHFILFLIFSYVYLDSWVELKASEYTPPADLSTSCWPVQCWPRRRKKKKDHRKMFAWRLINYHYIFRCVMWRRPTLNSLFDWERKNYGSQ